MDILFFILLSFIGPIIYTMFYSLFLKRGSIDYKMNFKFLIVSGFICVAIVHLFSYLKIYSIFDNIHIFRGTSGKLFNYSFFNVALIEELSKLLTFSLAIIYVKRNSKFKNYLNYHFLLIIIAASFALVENILYSLKFGGQVLFIRTFTSTVLHLTSGVIMGYVYYLYNHYLHIKNDLSISYICKKKPILMKVCFSLMMLFFSTIVHGIYDFNLFIANHYHKIYKSSYYIDISYVSLYITLLLCIFINTFIITNISKLNSKDEIKF